MPETPVTSAAVYSAIPTIQVDGQLNDKVTTQLIGMQMREHEAGMSDLELRFSNFGSFAGGTADQVFEDGTILKLGAALIVYAGLVTSPTEIFRGNITALETYFPEQRTAGADGAGGGRAARRAHEAPHEELGRDFPLGHRAANRKRPGSDSRRPAVWTPVSAPSSRSTRATFISCGACWRAMTPTCRWWAPSCTPRPEARRSATRSSWI